MTEQTMGDLIDLLFGHFDLEFWMLDYVQAQQRGTDKS